MSRVQLSRAHHPVTTLGYGNRIGLWVQGCSIGCFSCVSRDTWPDSPETSVDVFEIIRWLVTIPAEQIDGITISGGEPFEQPDALRDLVGAFGAWRADTGRVADILVYSGHELSWVEQHHADILAGIDVLVPGPYIHELASDLPLRGSSNQLVVPMTALGHARYDDLEPYAQQREQMQLGVDDSDVWFVGIPKRGDMRRLRSLAGEAGLTFRSSSWLL